MNPLPPPGALSATYRRGRGCRWLWVWPLLLLCGCAPAGELYSLVVPEQTNLQVRPPEQIVGAASVAFPEPSTVSRQAPADAGKNLSLDEAIRVALANSTVIRVLVGGAAVTSSLQTIYDPAIVNTTIDQARAAFDPSLSVQNTWRHIDDPLAFLDPTSPRGASIGGILNRQYDLHVGLSQRNITGGTLGFDFNNALARFRPGLFPLNPQDSFSLALSYTQPLLKGAGIKANIAPIVIARLNTERSYFQLKDSVQDLVRGTIEAYWNVVFARIDVWSKRQQVEQGEEGYRFADAKQRGSLGNAADVAQAKVALSNFKANLISAQANLLEREDVLRNILGLPPTEPARIIPVTGPMSVRIEPNWDEVVKLAEERRPDLVELRLILEADQQALIQADNQALPQVDTALVYKWNGLEGTTPSGASLSAVGGQFVDWSLGVNFSVPLGLRQGRAALRSAELVVTRDRANLEQGLHAAIHELASNFRSIDQRYEQYLAYKETRIAAYENLKQQMAVWRSGIGKTGIYLNVLQAISDWGNAISFEALALTQYNTELANLERRTGTILETHGVWFFEERFRAIGPLGRLGPQRCYPAAVNSGPNAPRYPAGTEPADKAFQQDSPNMPKTAPAAPALLGRPSVLPPAILQSPVPSAQQLPDWPRN